jgi:hypothetical protein
MELRFLVQISLHAWHISDRIEEIFAQERETSENKRGVTMQKTYGFDTLQLHAGWRGDPATGAHTVPLYQTSAYLFESAEDAAAQFTGEVPGSIYTRIANPTVAILEERVRALENGQATVCFASGGGAGAGAYALRTGGRNRRTLLALRRELRAAVRPVGTPLRGDRQTCRSGGPFGAGGSHYRQNTTYLL